MSDVFFLDQVFDKTRAWALKAFREWQDRDDRVQVAVCYAMLQTRRRPGQAPAFYAWYGLKRAFKTLRLPGQGGVSQGKNGEGRDIYNHCTIIHCGEMPNVRSREPNPAKQAAANELRQEWLKTLDDDHLEVAHLLLNGIRSHKAVAEMMQCSRSKAHDLLSEVRRSFMDFRRQKSK